MADQIALVDLDTEIPEESAAPTRSRSPLAVRDFRLLWIGESISLLGDQFYMIALPWLVLQITGNALVLGTVMALAGVPRALFMLVGGAFVDRFSPRAILLISNLARMLLVTLLTILVLTNAIQLWMLYLFALAFGLSDAFYFPGQNAIIPQLLDEDQLEAGNMLIQGMAQFSLFAGPVVAGFLIALLAGQAPTEANVAAGGSTTGIGIAMALDAFSFLAALAALLMMQVRKPRKVDAHEEGVLTSIKAGIAFVWDTRILRVVFILAMGINFLINGPFEVGVPVLAKTNLAEGAAAFGIIMSAFGGGALLGIVLAGVLPRPRPALMGTVLMSLLALLGIGLALLPFSHSTAIVAFVSLVMGTTNGYVNLSFITWLQKRIPDHLMGRVMSLLMFASFGLMPISSGLAGALLQVNLTGLFIGAGVLMTGMSIYALSVPVLRQMGLDTADQSIQAAIRKTGELSAVQP